MYLLTILRKTLLYFLTTLLMIYLSDFDLYSRCIDLALREKWHLLLAKRETTGSDSLLTHTLNVMSAAEIIMKILSGFSETERVEVLAGCFIHDSGKEDEKAQGILSGRNQGPFRHKEDKDRKTHLLKEIGIDEALHEVAIAIDMIMERPESSGHKIDIVSTQAPEEKIWRAAQLADQIVSRKSLNNLEVKEGTLLAETLTRLDLSLSYHKVSVIRGIVTQLLHNGVKKAYEKHGWIPILYYPDGTAYISRGANTIFPDKEEILQNIKEEVESYFNGIPPSELGASAFSGDIRISVLSSPEFLFRDDKCIEAFWQRVEGQRAIREASFPKEKRKAEEWEMLLTNKPNEDRAVIGLKYKKVRATTRLTLVMKEIAACCEAKEPKAWNFFLKELQERFQMSADVGKNLRRLANTTPAEQLVQIYESLTKPTNMDERDVELLIEKLTEHFKEITKKLRQLVSDKIAIDSRKVAEQLLGDLEIPLVRDLRTESLEAVKEYRSGKVRGSVSCVLCGSRPVTRGTEPLIGEGVESFINLMKGGTRIGGIHKAWICGLCDLEAKIRLVFISSHKETLLILPQLNIGESLRKKWDRLLKHLIDGMEERGLKPLKDRYWIDVVIDGKLNEDERQILDDVVRKDTFKGTRTKAISKWLEDRYSSIDEMKAFLASASNVKDFENAAIQITDGKIRLPTQVAREMEEDFKRTSGMHSSYVSPNYILVASSFPIAQLEESETSAILRKVFIGLLLSRLFLASVMYSDIVLGIYYHVEPTKGYFKLPKKLGLAGIYKKLGIKEWVRINQADEVLLKLALYLKLDDMLLATRAGFGKDNLLNILKRHPGEVLNRHLQVSKEFSPALHAYLLQAS